MSNIKERVEAFFFSFFCRRVVLQGLAQFHPSKVFQFDVPKGKEHWVSSFILFFYLCIVPNYDRSNHVVTHYASVNLQCQQHYLIEFYKKKCTEMSAIDEVSLVAY